MGFSPGRPTAVALLLLLAACVAVRPPGADAASARRFVTVDAISAESFGGWGRPAASWRIDSHGDGEYREPVPAPSGGFYDYDIVIKRFGVGPRGFERIRAILRPVERYTAPPALRCTFIATDSPTGDVHWTMAAAASSFHYSDGCRSAEALRVYGLVYEAYDVIASWVADSPESARERHRQ